MKHAFVYRNGERLAVVRPADPKMALELVRELQSVQASQTEEQNQRRFNEILCSQPYTYVGLLSKTGGRLLNKGGWSIGKMKPGDSFVGFESFKGKAEDEIIDADTLKIGQVVEFLKPDEDPTQALGGSVQV